jgi:hypothetical protein
MTYEDKTDRFAEIEHKAVVCRGIAWTPFLDVDDCDWLIGEVRRLRKIVNSQAVIANGSRYPDMGSGPVATAGKTRSIWLMEL